MKSIELIILSGRIASKDGIVIRKNRNNKLTGCFNLAVSHYNSDNVTYYDIYCSEKQAQSIINMGYTTGDTLIIQGTPVLTKRKDGDKWITNFAVHNADLYIGPKALASTAGAQNPGGDNNTQQRRPVQNSPKNTQQTQMQDVTYGTEPQMPDIPDYAPQEPAGPSGPQFNEDDFSQVRKAAEKTYGSFDDEDVFEGDDNG